MVNFKKNLYKMIGYLTFFVIGFTVLFGFVLPYLFSAKSDVSVIAGAFLLVIVIRYILVKIIKMFNFNMGGNNDTMDKDSR